MEQETVSAAFERVVSLWQTMCSPHVDASVNARFFADMHQARLSHASLHADVVDEIVQRWYLWIVEHADDPLSGDSAFPYFDLEEAFLYLQTALRAERSA